MKNIHILILLGICLLVVLFVTLTGIFVVTSLLNDGYLWYSPMVLGFAFIASVFDYMFLLSAKRCFDIITINNKWE